MKLRVLLLVGLAGCFGETSVVDDGGTPEPEPVSREGAALEAYAPCSSDADCGDLECVTILGQSVCSQTGCADGAACAPNEICVESPAVHPSGVCARTGSGGSCGRACADPLRCGLDPACIEAGCCGALDERGCPMVCGTIDPMMCVIDPRCREGCCE
ncbi:MAG: hypothetical protein AAGE52_34595 [Myxococcota bacterium]